MRVLFMRLAFESLDLEKFSNYELQTRTSYEPRILVIERGSHVLSPAFELQSWYTFTVFKILTLCSFFL